MPHIKASDLVESPEVGSGSTPLMPAGGGISRIIVDVKEILQLIAQIQGRGASLPGFPRPSPNPEPNPELRANIPVVLSPPSLADQLRPALDAAIKMGLGDKRLGDALNEVPFTLNQLKEMIK